MKDKRTAVEYILLIAMCLVFVGLAQFAGCFAHASESPEPGCYAVYATKPTGEVINYRPYYKGMPFGRKPQKNCIIVLIKDATKVQMEELKGKKYTANWRALESINQKVENADCYVRTKQHQPFLDNDRWLDLKKDSAVFQKDKKWFDGAALTTAATVKTEIAPVEVSK